MTKLIRNGRHTRRISNEKHASNINIHSNIKSVPHGSGVNYDYEIRVSGSRLYVSNSYDVYDDYGMFIGDLPFTACFKNGKLAYIQFNGLTPRGYYIANKYAIKEYLYDLYYDVENKIAVAMGTNWELLDIGENGYMMVNEW